MIIPVFHHFVSNFPIDATTTFEAGMAVALDSDGKAVKADGASGWVIGLAADRNRASEAYEWVNRVSDSGNDTAGSGNLSVYHGGGEFYLDVNDGAITTPQGTTISGVLENGKTYTPGTRLYADDSGTDGTLTTDSSSTTQVVAVVLEAAAALDSGIPGEYEPGATVEYVDDATNRTFVKVKLEV